MERPIKVWHGSTLLKDLTSWVLIENSAVVDSCQDKKGAACRFDPHFGLSCHFKRRYVNHFFFILFRMIQSYSGMNTLSERSNPGSERTSSSWEALLCNQISFVTPARIKELKGRNTVTLQPVIEGFRTLIHSSMSPVSIHQCHHGFNLESIVSFTHQFED